MADERVRPEGENASDDLMISHHMARYEWAIEQGLLQGPVVLDLGCGEGYGTEMLRKANFSVKGMDISSTVVQEAINKYGGDFFEGDIRSIPLPDQSVNSVVCFEVIEHIELDSVAFSEMHRILQPKGILIISTPNILTYKEAGQNPFHLHEFSRQEMESYLIKAGFHSIRFFGQDSNHPIVKGFYEKPWLRAYLRLKRAVGLTGPLFSKKIIHGVEKLATGHSSSDWKNEKIWTFNENNDTAEMMLFVAVS